MRRKLVLGSVAFVMISMLLGREIVLATVRSRAEASRSTELPIARARATAELTALRAELMRAILAGERSESFRRAIGSTDDTARRRRMFECLEEIALDLGRSALPDLGRPDIAAFVDVAGRVVVRDHDPNRLRGRALAADVPVVARALREGRPAFDLARREDDGATLLVAVDPVVEHGAIVVAYQLGDGIARRLASAAGHDVAFVSSSGVLGASLREASVREAVGASVASGASHGGEATIAGEAVDVAVDGAPLALFADVPVTLALVQPVDADGLAADLGRVLLLVTVVAGALAYLLANLLARRVLAPVGRLEDALLAVMNGQETLGVAIESEELGGLSFRIEQVIETLRQRAQLAASGLARGPAAVRATSPVQNVAAGVILGPAELGRASA